VGDVANAILDGLIVSCSPERPPRGRLSNTVNQYAAINASSLRTLDFFYQNFHSSFHLFPRVTLLNYEKKKKLFGSPYDISESSSKTPTL
jgi:serine protease inhibitor